MRMAATARRLLPFRLVRAVGVAQGGAPTPPVSLRYPPQPAASFASFDASADRINLEATGGVGSESILGRFATVSYGRPEETSGVATAAVPVAG